MNADSIEVNGSFSTSFSHNYAEELKMMKNARLPVCCCFIKAETAALVRGEMTEKKRPLWVRHREGKLPTWISPWNTE